VAGLVVVLAGVLLATGCARYNTFYNAEKAFNDAEQEREDKLRQGQDVTQPSGTQRQSYQTAVKKAQKILDNYPGHGLTDDALFLQGKAYHRLASYRMSVRKLDLLFTNFPQTPFLEESIFLQAVNYLMLGDAGRSQDFLDRLARQFPESRFQSEALRASGDNAYALEDWEDAAAAYRRYLDRFPDADDWDDSTLRLGEALFELGRYDEAAGAVERVVDESPQADRVFRARLLQARASARAGDHAAADALVSTLKDEADIYGQQGAVALVEAENLVQQGDLRGAITLLEGVPEDQITREVKPQRADLLGRSYLYSSSLETEQLENARDAFQQAVSGASELDDPDDTRRLLSTVRDYLAAANELPDAPPTRAASLRLLQANALLFGFERPRLAHDLYTAVAADSAADTTVAARALFGAMLVQEAYLEQPDSAAVFADALQQRFPDSPQAYEARSGADADLLAFLLERQALADQLARAAAETVGVDAAVPELDQVPGDAGLRRRQVYLQRRPNLVYAPSEAEVRALEAIRLREAEDLADQEAAGAAGRAAAVQPAAGDTVSFDGPAAGTRAAAADTAAGLSRPAPGAVLADSLAAGRPQRAQPAPPDTAAAAAADTAAVEPEPEDEPEQEKPRSWDF